MRTILEMVNHTRLDCVLGSAALIRRAVAEANSFAWAPSIVCGRATACTTRPTAPGIPHHSRAATTTV